MPDGLAHVLFAYTACTALSWRYEWLTTPYRTAAMAGGLIPDLSKIGVFVDAWRVRNALGLSSFSFDALETGGAAAVCVAVGALFVVPRERRRTAGALAVGATTHLLADATLAKPTGHSYAVAWPLTRYYFPTPGLFKSTEPVALVVALLLAVSVWLLDRRRTRARASAGDER